MDLKYFCIYIVFIGVFICFIFSCVILIFWVLIFLNVNIFFRVWGNFIFFDDLDFNLRDIYFEIKYVILCIMYKIY